MTVSFYVILTILHVAAPKRIDEQKALTTTVQSLALSVEKLVLAQQHTAEGVKKLEEDVGALKEKPAKRWEALVGAGISVLVGGFIGYMMK